MLGRLLSVAGFLMLGVSAVSAQAPMKALLLSDIHFDPFRYPSQFAELNSSPASAWPSILSKPVVASAEKPEPCPSRGLDTDWTLLQSSLKAERAALPKPAFITVSGDLMGHEFDCRYAAMTGKESTSAQYSAFAAKVVTFVTAQVRATFPGTPVYFALGNNDSGCGDYFEDFGSAYLKSAGRDFAASLKSPASRKSLTLDLPAEGGNVAALPVAHARMIVLQNIFESGAYKTCAKQPSPDAMKLQLTWLRKQLEVARKAHDAVWLMAHIPTGVNVYSTVKSKANLCEGGKPTMFLQSNALADVIAEYADVLKLVIMAHTHNDEIHVYGSAGKYVPTKIVPSVSPINGNAPSFTVADVDAKTAVMRDYAVFSANNLSGVDATWHETYRFSKMYGEPDFSGASVADLAHKLTADHVGQSAVAESYEKLWFPGDTGFHAAAAMLLWPVYSCSVVADHAEAYRECVCGAGR